MLEDNININDIDIIDIDNKIKKNFEEEKQKINEYKEKLNELKTGLNLVMRAGLKEKIIKNERELSEYIHEIENDCLKNFYILESVPIIEKYQEFLKTPLKVSFNGNIKSKQNKLKKELINNYLLIATKYIDLNINLNNYEKNTKEKIVCLNCKNYKEFDIDEESDICICLVCHAQQIILKNISSYKDSNRVNMSSKYQYDRKIHFRDSINQYGGKQNVSIPHKIYDDLETQFKLHHLIKDTDDTLSKHEKFKNITKEQISIFLKELNYSKHYENLNLIYYNITGNKPDDITYLEDKLLSDFDILTEVYDRKFKNIDRKNFINTHYVLLQLLLKHRHPCNKEDFSMLKTIDRQIFHENICRLIFEELGWNWTSIY
jgi:hypothetical protein